MNLAGGIRLVLVALSPRHHRLRQARTLAAPTATLCGRTIMARPHRTDWFRRPQLRGRFPPCFVAPHQPTTCLSPSRTLAPSMPTRKDAHLYSSLDAHDFSGPEVVDEVLIKGSSTHFDSDGNFVTVDEYERVPQPTETVPPKKRRVETAEPSAEDEVDVAAETQSTKRKNVRVYLALPPTARIDQCVTGRLKDLAGLQA